MCPTCPLLAPLNDTRVVHAAEAALAAFNAQNNGSYYQLLEISRAQLVVKQTLRQTGQFGGTCSEVGVRKGQVQGQQPEGEEGVGWKEERKVS